MNVMTLSLKQILKDFSRYAKAKDSAVGTSFDEHVMGGYKVATFLTLFRPDCIVFIELSRQAPSDQDSNQDSSS